MEVLQHAAVVSVTVFTGACVWVFPQAEMNYIVVTSTAGQLILPVILGIVMGSSVLGVKGSEPLKGGLSVLVGLSAYVLLTSLWVEAPQGINLLPFAPPLEWAIPVAVVVAVVVGVRGMETANDHESDTPSTRRPQ